MNNRSLFPSQDMPKAMSTWHCNVTLANDWKNFNVITTGETLPEKFQVKGRLKQCVIKKYCTLE